MLHRALDSLERGILYLSGRVVDTVSSPTLSVELVKIVAKLTEAMKCRFVRETESFGARRVVEVVAQAVAMGGDAAKTWIMDSGFAEYLTFHNINQPMYRVQT